MPLHQWLATWPVEMPRNWVQWINEPQTEAELAALRRSRGRGSPYGEPRWAATTAKRLGIESSLGLVGWARTRKGTEGL